MGLACNHLIGNIAWRVIVDALDQLVFEGEPVTHDFKDLYAELKCIRDGNDTRSRKLQKLSVELLRFASRLASYSGRQASYWRKLSAGLGSVGPWLNSLSEQWLTLELLVEQCHAQQSLLGKAANLTGLTRRLLADRQLQTLVGQGRVQQLDQRLASFDQLLAQVRLWQALPGGAGIADYLQLVAGNPLLGGALADSLMRLGRVLGRVQKGYPDAGTLAEKLSWLLCTLSDPALREPLQPHLERLLGNAQQVEQLFSLCRVVESLRHFPLGGALAEQTLWLLSLLKDNAGDGKMGAWFCSLDTVLGADPATLSLLNRLLGMKSGPDGVRLLIKDLFALLAFPVARQLAGYALPGVVELEKLYRQSTADESWASLVRRIGWSVVDIAKPYAVGALVHSPLAAATVGYAEALRTHTGWEQTCQWFVAHAPAGDLRLQLAYSQYLNALLVWQVYQACAGHDPQQSEERLRHLARQLKEYQVVKSYPDLEPLIDLLPLLPLLMEARQSVSVQPGADSWLGWGAQWLNALADSASRNRSASKLQQRLSRQLEHWLADALMAAVSKLPIGPPGAAAAPTSGAADRAFQPMSAGLDSQRLLLGGISLEAVGLGAIAYALWQSRQAGDADAPVAEAETGLMDAIPRAAGRGLHEHKTPLLLGVAAMAAGGFMLYRWTCSEVPADRLIEAGEEREADFDLPIYTPYVNEVLAQVIELVEASPQVPLAERFGHDTSARPVFFKRSDRVKRVVGSQRGQRESQMHLDPAIQLAWQALDFSKYDDLVARRLERLWRDSITLNDDKSLSVEQKKALYLTQFHQYLVEEIDATLGALNELKQAGTYSHSGSRNAILWMARLAAEAEELQERFSASGVEYWEAWRHDSRGETLSALNRAFKIQQREDDTYFKQRQAWMQPAVITDADYLQAPELNNTQKMWRSALVIEQREFEKLIDDYARLKNFEALPDLFVNALEMRVELLGAERYELLNEEDLSAASVQQRAVKAEILEMRKMHLANALIEEVESYAICKQLKERGPLVNKYSGHQAVFEAKKIAVELVLEKFAVGIVPLDDDDKIIGFYQIARDDSASDQVKAYLSKAGALAFFMMTNASQASEYQRWNKALAVSFAQACPPTEYFKRLYEDKPEGYRGLDTFKKSSESETWVDYYDQFIQYREKYLDFDSRQMAYGALANQGLTDYSISQLQVEKIVYADLVVYFNASTRVDELLLSGAARDPGNKFHNMLNDRNEVPGTIGFITLANGGILAMAGLAFKVTVKLFAPAAVGASQVLSKIHSLAAIPYLGALTELEGKKLIDDVLRPMGVETDALIGNSGYPIFKAPRKFRGWWERHKVERVHPKQGCSLISVAEEVMRENLSQWVGLLKVANKDNDFWSVVLSFLPLYTELRDAYADADHQLNGNRVMWDVLGIILSILPGIGAITQLSATALKMLVDKSMRGLAAGLSFKVVTRQILLRLITDPAFTGLGLQGFVYAAYIGFEVVSPLPAPLCVYGIMWMSKGIRAHIQHGYTATDSLLSPRHASTIPKSVQAELTALGATTPVLVGPSKRIVLRNSALTPREVIEEGMALAAPLHRKLAVMKRIKQGALYSTDPGLCAPPALCAERSLEYMCLDDLDYLHAKNVIDSGDGYTVYPLRNSNGAYVVREFRLIRHGDQPQRIRKAENNQVAYNRLYGGQKTDAAKVFYFVGEGPVVTLLPSTPGKKLSQIIADDDRTAIEGLRLLDKPLVVEQLVTQLRDMGIYYRAVNFAGIVYDPMTRAVRLNNFDNSLVNVGADDANARWEVLTTAQVGALNMRFTQVFTDFTEQTKGLLPNDLGINTSMLTENQLAQLDPLRARYANHIKVMESAKSADIFKFAKKHHRGFLVPGVNRTDSELVLTTLYNDLIPTADVTQLGALSGFIENTRQHRTIHAAISVAAKYSKRLNNGSYRQMIAPQSFWLSAADAPRAGEGRCYPLVLAVAVAIMEYSSTNFFMNMMRSAARTDSSRNEFIRAIDQIRTLDMNQFITPQLNASPNNLEKILTHLASLKRNSLFMLDSRSHSMLIGVTFNIFGEDSFYFYDPNIGIFFYPDIDVLATALHSTVGSGSLAAQYSAWNVQGTPKYKLALINTNVLKGKSLQVPPAGGSGFRTRTVGELSSSLDAEPHCLLQSLARQKRAPGCTPIESDITLMRQTQEALFTGETLPDGSYQRALDFAVLLRDQYPARFMQGLDMERDFAFLELTRQQLIEMDAAAAALPAAGNGIASCDAVERRGVYFNYLTALITVGNRMVRFDKGHRD